MSAEQDVESPRFSVWNSSHINSQQWRSRSCCVCGNFLTQSHLKCHQFPWNTTKVVLVCCVPCVTQCLSRPTFTSHDSLLSDTQHCSCSIMMTNKGSSGQTTCKCADTILSNFTKPDFFSILCHRLSPSSSGSSHFARFSIFATSHFVHDLHFKARKPAE